MSSFSICIKRIKERPIIVIMLAFMTLCLTAAEQYNPITKKFGSLSKIIKIRYLDLLSDLANEVKSFFGTTKLAITSIAIILFVLLVVSAVIGLIFSGYAHVFYQAVNDRKKSKGDFRNGISRNFGKMTFYFFLFFVCTAIFLFMILYAAIPAIMTVMIFLEGNTGVIFQMLLLCILTVLVVFFAVVFYYMYFSFMVPSITGFKRGGFGVSLRMVNGYCWYLIPRTLLFFVITLGIRVALLALSYGNGGVVTGVIILGFSWFLRTICYFIYFYYVFNTFVAMKDDMFMEAQ